jgi:hypothetical protein
MATTLAPLAATDRERRGVVPRHSSALLRISSSIPRPVGAVVGTTGDAEFCGERLRVDDNAFPPGFIHEIQAHDDAV